MDFLLNRVAEYHFLDFFNDSNREEVTLHIIVSVSYYIVYIFRFFVKVVFCILCHTN